LDKVSFRFNDDSNWILKDINLKIKKRDVVGLIGKSGSGKSTLADIIMGLLVPTKGRLIVDGVEINKKNIRAWHKYIAHVPQTIFLADSTISENIAFGVPKNMIDHTLVQYSAEMAQISSTIASWPAKYNTVVGERGALLSGGQRQRLGIARAFYKQAKIIIFDEATSSLDRETENLVTRATKNLIGDTTIIIIAHKISALKNCNIIYDLSSFDLQKL
jgi:ATP-binding cassette subfamily B protein